VTEGWFYNDELIDDESQFPEKTLGFVYKITRLSDGKFYYGKKLAYFKKTSVRTVVLKNGTKKKKKISTLVPSDWKTYWSSSPELLADVEKYGSPAFIREILCFCENKGSLGYYEMKFQMDARVLENRETTYNGIVNARVHWSHIKPILEK
jgi:hypothetical protein